MPYPIILSDGLTQLVTVPDNNIIGPSEANPSNCSLNLVGRGSVNYGLVTATNFVWMLQNFANTTAPVSPLAGQLWYNNTANAASLNLYTVSGQWVQIPSSNNSFTLTGASNAYRLYDPTQGTNAKYSDWSQANGVVSFRLNNDALTAANPYLTVTRNGYVVNTVTLYGKVATPSGITSITQPSGDASTNVATTAFVANGFLPLTGGVLANASNSAILTLNAATPSAAEIVFGATGDANAVTSSRWTLGKNADPETSTTVGSNFILSAQDGLGNTTNVFTAYRNNGVVAFGNTITTVTQPLTDSSSNVATTAFVQRVLPTFVSDTLTANTTLYVATTGSDTLNTGLSPSSPFATIQHAVNYAYQNFNFGFQYGVTISIGAGTYSAGATFEGAPAGAPITGVVAFTLTGVAGSTILSITAANTDGIIVGGPVIVEVSNLTITTASSTSSQGYALIAENGGTIIIGSGMVFGSCNAAHMFASIGGYISCEYTNYTITGGATQHMSADACGVINNIGGTVTLSGSPVFENYVYCQNVSSINAYYQVFSGTIGTGTTKYTVTTNGVIYTAGSGANYFPGTIAGNTGNGGQYV